MYKPIRKKKKTGVGWESNKIIVFGLEYFFPSFLIVVFIFIFKIYDKTEKEKNTKGSDKIRREAYGGGGR